MDQRGTGNYSSCGSGPNNINPYDNTNGLSIFILIPLYCFTFILVVFPNVLVVYLSLYFQSCSSKHNFVKVPVIGSA